MLREILSITGRPGLFRIVAQAKNTIIVEDVVSKKRMPVYPRDKVVSLGDIAMYTESGDTPLGEILDKVYAAKNGEKINVSECVKAGKLRDEFGAIIPDYDRDRVYESDIKKLFTWYNILLDGGFTKFTAEKESEEQATE